MEKESKKVNLQDAEASSPEHLRFPPLTPSRHPSLPLRNVYDTLPRQLETLYLPRSVGYQISGRRA